MIDRCSSDFSWLLNGLRIPFFFFFFLPPRLFSPPVESPIAWWSICARISTFPFRVGREKKDRYLKSGCFVN